MLRMNRQGFTLIELMVVIVIIGVLASLAIPRFTEASAKAKIAEAPRVLASYESAYLAAVAEQANVTGGANALIFETPNDSKWFQYAVLKKDRSATATDDGDDPGSCIAATAQNNGKGTPIGSFPGNGALWTTYSGKTFAHLAGTGSVAQPAGNDSENALNAAKKMIPNFNANPVGSQEDCDPDPDNPSGKIWDNKEGECVPDPDHTNG
jgi:prepilin-type N-terminal cleavage/methylation domain-containing protein